MEWFGKTPYFHDPAILEISLVADSVGVMKIHAWNMTDQVDSEGYFETEKHAVVVISFGTTQLIEIENFHLDGIILKLEFKGTQERTEVTWVSSYGAEGRIVGTGVNLKLTPGKPKPTNGS